MKSSADSNHVRIGSVISASWALPSFSSGRAGSAPRANHCARACQQLVAEQLAGAPPSRPKNTQEGEEGEEVAVKDQGQRGLQGRRTTGTYRLLLPVCSQFVPNV